MEQEKIVISVDIKSNVLEILYFLLGFNFKIKRIFCDKGNRVIETDGILNKTIIKKLQNHYKDKIIAVDHEDFYSISVVGANDCIYVKKATEWEAMASQFGEFFTLSSILKLISLFAILAMVISIHIVESYISKCGLNSISLEIISSLSQTYLILTSVLSGALLLVVLILFFILCKTFFSFVSEAKTYGCSVVKILLHMWSSLIAYVGIIFLVHCFSAGQLLVYSLVCLPAVIGLLSCLIFKREIQNWLVRIGFLYSAILILIINVLGIIYCFHFPANFVQASLLYFLASIVLCGILFAAANVSRDTFALKVRELGAIKRVKSELGDFKSQSRDIFAISLLWIIFNSSVCFIYSKINLIHDVFGIGEYRKEIPVDDELLKHPEVYLKFKL